MYTNYTTRQSEYKVTLRVSVCVYILEVQGGVKMTMMEHQQQVYGCTVYILRFFCVGVVLMVNLYVQVTPVTSPTDAIGPSSSVVATFSNGGRER